MSRSYLMDSQPRLRASRFVVAVAGSVALVLSAPFIGYVRAWIRSQFPGQFVQIVGGLIAVLGVAAIGIALARIRDRRAVRYAAIAGALIAAVVVFGRLPRPGVRKSTSCSASISSSTG